MGLSRDRSSISEYRQFFNFFSATVVWTFESFMMIVCIHEFPLYQDILIFIAYSNI